MASPDQPSTDSNLSDHSPSSTPPNRKLLEAAWQRQDIYSENAARYQKRFVLLRALLATLSVAVVILSVLEDPEGEPERLYAAINWALLILPITITALLAFAVRFDRGQNWILLRGSAESIKMEIYYYRTHVKPYDKNRDDMLAQRIKQFSERMKGSPVHQSALSPFEGESPFRVRMGIVTQLVYLGYCSITVIVNLFWSLLFEFKEQPQKPKRDTLKVGIIVRLAYFIYYRVWSLLNWIWNLLFQFDNQSNHSTQTTESTLEEASDPASSSENDEPLRHNDSSSRGFLNSFKQLADYRRRQREEQKKRKADKERQKKEKADQRFSDLTSANQYLAERLEDQFNWYRKKSKVLARQLQMYETGVYLFGGIGTLLAATDTLKGWVAVTTAFTGALTNFLEFKRVEASLMGYNQAADTLYDIRAWWYSLSASDKEKQINFVKLVKNCEETIRNENMSWLQDMQERLSQLYGSSDEDESKPKAPSTGSEPSQADLPSSDMPAQSE
jgi:hypothetical protein